MTIKNNISYIANIPFQLKEMSDNRHALRGIAQDIAKNLEVNAVCLDRLK